MSRVVIVYTDIDLYNILIIKFDSNSFDNLLGSWKSWARCLKLWVRFLFGGRRWYNRCWWLNMMREIVCHRQHHICWIMFVHCSADSQSETSVAGKPRDGLYQQQYWSPTRLERHSSVWRRPLPRRWRGLLWRAFRATSVYAVRKESVSRQQSHCQHVVKQTTCG